MQVLLISINAKNIHKALAPWCIKAYCDEQKDCKAHFKIDILECNINEGLTDILSEIYHYSPDIIGFSCYIWNIEVIIRLAAEVKKILPGSVIVLGGPEVSHTDPKDFTADYIIQGPGEHAFYSLLKSLMNRDCKTHNENYNFPCLPSPYTAEYFKSFTESKMSSIKNQLVYIESSRGCPFSCAYCISSASDGVQYRPFSQIKNDIELLIHNGAKCIKFVDRTFNAHKKQAYEILEYIYSLETNCTFHFEAAADLFDDKLLDLISKMPSGRVQFELGIQSVNKATLKAVSRKTDVDKSLENIKKLIDMENCHIHVDLIAGLPHESPQTFKKAVDICLNLRPHMLQLGFLKMLKGSKLRELALSLGYIYTDFPPYEVLKSDCMSFDDILKLKDIERLIDKYYNSGMFINSVNFAVNNIFNESGYDFFEAFSCFCKTYNRNFFNTSLKNAYSLLLEFLLPHTSSEQAEHYIKLDCLTYDAKGILPDSIKISRDKSKESEFKKRYKENGYPYNNIRVEYFSYDKKYRLFIYDVKNPVNKAYKVIEDIQ